MKFHIGDTVKFIDDVGGGTIVEIIDSQRVKIEDEDDGFIIPVFVDQLMLVKSTFKPTEIKKEKLPENEIDKPVSKSQTNFFKSLKPRSISFSEVNILLVFLPLIDDIEFADLDAFIVNDCEYLIYFQVYACLDGSYQKIFAGKLESNMQMHLTTFKRIVFGSVDKLLFQGFVALDEFRSGYPTIEKTIKIKHERFLKPNAYKPSMYFDDCKAISYELFHSDFRSEVMNQSIEDIEKKMIQKQLRDDKKQYTKRNNKEIMEVDLHIQEIIDDIQGLSNAEMLAIQMNHFVKTLEDAMSRHIARIVFIHGKGKGTLKLEILKVLKKDYPHLQYQDASYKEYGFGATMVFLK